MKKIHLAPYCIVLLLGNCFLTSHLGQFVDVMRIVISHAGGKLLMATRFSLEMPLWLYILTALTALATVGCFIRRVSVSLLVHWLFCVCILEFVLLFCFGWGFWAVFNRLQDFIK
jgi:hypothetical protein